MCSERGDDAAYPVAAPVFRTNKSCSFIDRNRRKTDKTCMLVGHSLDGVSGRFAIVAELIEHVRPSCRPKLEHFAHNTLHVRRNLPRLDQQPVERAEELAKVVGISLRLTLDAMVD